MVTATYSGVTNYQWRLYSTNLVDQTNTTLSIPSVQSSSYGPYTVRVSDGYTAVTSVVANLTVPVQPKLNTVVSGTDLTLSFATESGLTYVVEHKTNLIDAVWYCSSHSPATAAP